MKEEQDRTPLRTILQNFINHIESLEIQNVEDRYEKEFQELKFFSEILKTSKQYSCSEGEKEVNRKKNRYKDILPFDSSRVILSEYAGVPGSDYINANYIKGASGSPAYIACQGPLPHTVNDFWRMVVECEVQVIVMACNEEEAGKHKCENYWVDREGEEKQFGMVAIRLVKASTVCPDFLVRTMRLKYVSSQLPHVSEERTVCQFHYSTWPDHGVPRLVRPLLDMVRLVRDTQASETLPVLVHCSAGCGRTGTICAIDYVWGLLRAGKLSKHFSLHKLVQDMRKQRIAMVQTKEQYILVHQAVRELFREQLRMIDSHPYENIDANGMPLVKEEQEPVYASPTIIVLAENNSEEKQDGKEKELEEQIPPLPQKKRSSIASSKQEKEVENLTEKQRSIVEQSGVGMLHKPRIAKLKALFERSSTTRESRSFHTKQQKCQLVTRSHSIGAVRVRAENQEEQVVVKAEGCREGNVNVNDPVVCNTSLHVSQRSTVQGSSPVRPTVPIKRSKSLKVLGSNQQYKLTLATAINSITPCSTTDDVSSVPSATSVKPSDNMLFHRDDGASNLKPAKKYLTRSKGVNISEPDIDSRRFSQRGNEHCVSQTHLNQMTYEGNSMVPRRRRSLESVNFEDMTVPGGTSLDCCKLVLQSSPQLQSTNVDAKLLQNSNDYTVSKIKHHVLCDHPANKLQNSEASDILTLEAQRKVNAIVAGLGIRERRNSFRQAVGTGQEGEVKSSRKLRDYETIWPSGNVISSPSGSVQSQGSSSSGSCVNVISGNSFTAGSDLMHSHIQTRKGKFGNWQETQNSQNPRDDRLQQPDEMKWPSVTCGLINNRVSEFKGLPVEGIMPKHGMNVYVKADKSDVRLEKSSVQPKNLLRSKVLIPERTELHHSQAGMDPKLSVDECPGRFSLSVDASNNSQSLPQCELTGQRPKSAALWQRKPKNHVNSKFIEFKPHSKQENSLQTTVDQELRTGPWVGMTAVTGKISAKKVSHNCSPSVSHHRNATGLVVSHGSSPGVGNAVQGQCKSVPAVCDAISRPAEVTAAPFTQPKKQYTKQPISYGLVAGIQLHRGSRDDLALCPSPSGAVGRSGPNAPSRVRRHASVVLLRRSLAEAGRMGPVNSSLSQPSLAVWNSTKSGSGEVLSKQKTHFCDQERLVASGSGSWLQAPGVDVDTVAASISLHHGGFPNQQKSSLPAASVKKQHYL